MVRAGTPPQWSIKRAIKRARKVEVVLQSPDYLELFRNIYGNEPAIWSKKLEGMERLRVITNYLTRMRCCTKDGWMDLETKGVSPDLGIEKVSA